MNVIKNRETLTVQKCTIPPLKKDSKFSGSKNTEIINTEIGNKKSDYLVMQLHPHFTTFLSIHQFSFVQAHNDLRNPLVLSSYKTLYKKYTSKDSQDRIQILKLD